MYIIIICMYILMFVHTYIVCILSRSRVLYIHTVCTYIQMYTYLCYVQYSVPIQFEWSSSGTVCVSRLAVSFLQFFEALDLCLAQNIPVTEDMADRMTVDKVEKGLKRHMYIL